MLPCTRCVRSRRSSAPGLTSACSGTGRGLIAFWTHLTPSWSSGSSSFSESLPGRWPSRSRSAFAVNAVRSMSLRCIPPPDRCSLWRSSRSFPTSRGYSAAWTARLGSAATSRVARAGDPRPTAGCWCFPIVEQHGAGHSTTGRPWLRASRYATRACEPGCVAQPESCAASCSCQMHLSRENGSAVCAPAGDSGPSPHPVFRIPRPRFRQLPASRASDFSQLPIARVTCT